MIYWRSASTSATNSGLQPRRMVKIKGVLWVVMAFGSYSGGDVVLLFGLLRDLAGCNISAEMAIGYRGSLDVTI